MTEQTKAKRNGKDVVECTGCGAIVKRENIVLIKGKQEKGHKCRYCGESTADLEPVKKEKR